MKIGNEDVSNEYVAQQLDLAAGVQSIEVTGETTDAAAITVDTGWKPADGVTARGDGGFNVKDVANTRTTSKNAALSLRNFGGLVVATDHAPIIAGATGDNATNNATIVFGVSAAGTLTVALTPPAGYVGKLKWRVSLGFTLN